MSYNNLLYLLVVIFLVTSAPDSAGYAAGFSAFAGLWFAKLGFLYVFCRALFSASRVYNAASYMKAERITSVLAIVSLAVDLYYFHGLYYLLYIPGFRQMPILAHVLGVSVFFLYLSVTWFVASGSHGRAFGSTGEPAGFIAENLRANLPIGLPWVVVSVCVDFLKVVPVAWLHHFMVNSYGEFAVFGLFFLFLAFLYPPLLMKVWRCTPVPAGAVRDELVGMCERQKLSYRDVLMWPLFGGQVLTAGVVGFVARFRYILITNGLLTNLTADEVESVIAHETGHVKYYHMPLYLFVLLGFSFIVAPLLCGVNYIVLQMDWAYGLMESMDMNLMQFVDMSETVVLFVTMILFLRFVFGYFMRNFERQADLHAFTATGGSSALVSSLEKVALLSGDIRDLPSWHHFGVGQRVDFLLDCEREPTLVKKHHRHVARMLLAYLLLIVVSIGTYVAIPADYLEGVVTGRLEGTLLSEVAKDPNNPELYWAMGDFYYRQNQYTKAIKGYQQSLALDEENHEVHNNLAWLLVTCEDIKVQDPVLGLEHAKRAVVLFPAPHILDTYAHALWVNGRYEQALQVEQEALAKSQNTRNRIQFRRQIEIWQRQQ